MKHNQIQLNKTNKIIINQYNMLFVYKGENVKCGAEKLVVQTNTVLRHFRYQRISHLMFIEGHFLIDTICDFSQYWSIRHLATILSVCQDPKDWYTWFSRTLTPVICKEVSKAIFMWLLTSDQKTVALGEDQIMWQECCLWGIAMPAPVSAS